MKRIRFRPRIVSKQFQPAKFSRVTFGKGLLSFSMYGYVADGISMNSVRYPFTPGLANSGISHLCRCRLSTTHAQSQGQGNPKRHISCFHFHSQLSCQITVYVFPNRDLSCANSNSRKDIKEKCKLHQERGKTHTSSMNN